MSKLPELFRLIIENDNQRKMISKSSVISNDNRIVYRSLRFERKEFSKAAEQYVKSQYTRDGDYA